MIWKRIFARNRGEDEAFSLYRAVVAQLRLPGFYLHGGVPDTVEGRFEMVCLHAFLVLRQRLFDILFDDMDQTLREMGVGDLSVGKKIKAMASSFYGRIGAYEEGLRADGEALLAEALARNVFGETETTAQAVGLASYARRCDLTLAAQPFEEITAGRVDFMPPPEEAGAAAGLAAGI